MIYRVGDVVIFRPVPRDVGTCYSPIDRPFEPDWLKRKFDHYQAQPGDPMEIVFIDEVGGMQRLWYKSVFATYGPAPAYETPGPGEWGCHNVLARSVRLSMLSRIRRWLERCPKKP